MNRVEILEQKISQFKQKLLFNLLLRGIAFFLIIILTSFIFINYLEYFLYLPSIVKTVILFSFLSGFIFLLIKEIILPIKNYLSYESSLSNEFVAKIIGNHFPDIKDKLLNTIQLQSSVNQELALQSINQRAENLSNYNFDFAIQKEENKKLYLWLILPFILLIFTGLYNSNVIFEGSQRLLDFNKTYQPPIPFEIELLNSPLKAYKNEDFEITFNIEGEFAAENIYVNINGVSKKPKKGKEDSYTYTIKNISNETDFNISVSGYQSENYSIEILNRPELLKSVIDIRFPKYLNYEDKSISNLSNLTVPEGTNINWFLKSSHTENTSFKLNNSELQIQSNDVYSANIRDNSKYSIELRNEHSVNKNKYEYSINVIKDQKPTITLNSVEDTSMYSYIFLQGEVKDDYGFNRMVLKYKINDGKVMSKNISINRNQPNQSYIYNWVIDSLKLTREDKIEYYLEIWDNDGVNGSKKSATVKKSFKVPDLEELNKKTEKESKNIENQLDKSLKDIKKEREDSENLEQEVKQKKKLDWNDKKQIEQKVKKQQELREELEKLNQKFQELNKKQDKLSEQSESIKEKSKQLEKLMNEVLDEETKKLYEELQKLLNENKPNDEKIKQALEEMNKKDENLEKELERALDLMKQLKLQMKTENLANKLEELAKKEEELSEETKNKSSDNQELKDKQEEIKEEFDKAKEELKELDKLNEELNKEEGKFEEETSDEKENAEQEMNNSQEQLSKNQNKKASESQKNASEQMKKMSDKLNEMAMSGEMDQQEEDLQTIRQILENLVTLSFNQENLMDDFKKIKKVNPQFVEKSSEQIKIKDDSQIIEDSLLALASRNFQIESFVTDELFEMNDKIDKSLEAIRDREVNKITVNQHLAMTSMNNLALLLSDVAEQMQQQMAKKMDGNQQCNKPKNKPGGKKLSMLQSELSKKISELKKSGKQGKELSEELAKLAAEQEAIREALKEQEQKEGSKPGDNGKLKKLMEENEKDLVNKRLLNLSQQRQEEILNRLLKSEKAMRERELNEKREAEKAKQTNRNLPPAIEDYLKEKEKEIELLKTVSPQYSPYYKEEIKEYFGNETK